MNTAKQVVESVLTPATTKKYWTINYWPALPFTPQDFSMGAVLTAVFYMFRWGKRRGSGKFNATFGTINETGNIKPTIEKVSSQIVMEPAHFEGFETRTGQAILGDLLLTFCLENKKHLTGRNQQIQRVYPIHYLASWIDLPEHVTNLRYIPELLVSILSGNTNNARSGAPKSLFPLAQSFEDNLLLNLFGSGMKIRGQLKTDKTSDIFIELDERALDVGLDQLLLIRVAQACQEAPSKARGTGEVEDIPKRQPLAKEATQRFKEDINVLIQAYGCSVPRKAFSVMLEACFSLGFTNIYMSTLRMLINWEKQGKLTALDQEPWSFFVDCSVGTDFELRRVAEESMENMLRAYERFPVILMMLRILDEKTRYDRYLKNMLPPDNPDATDFINLLGSVLNESHPFARGILNNLEEECHKLADGLKDADENLPVVELLRLSDPNAVHRLSEALVNLMGSDRMGKHFLPTLDALLMTNSQHGLCRKRTKLRKNSEGKQSGGETRSIVLSNTMLDFLVHRHLRKDANGEGSTRLSLPHFVNVLQQRYGLYVNESPSDMSISSELLAKNKKILERRLRDLGLLVGVNDAESMKSLRQRFAAQ